MSNILKDSTNLLAVDFKSIMDEVLKDGGLADRFFPEWTDRSESDFGRFLIELMAMMSDKDFFYINHFSKESFVAVADEYRSIYHKALSNGLKPPTGESAKGSIELVFSPGSSEYVPKGAIQIGSSTIRELVYTNEAFTIPYSEVSRVVSVPFIHGSTYKQEDSFDGSSILVFQKGISNGSVRLFIDGDEWTEVTSFLGGGTSTKHYMVFYDESGRAEIIFPKNGMGFIPNKGTQYIVEYVVGGGYIGDIADETLDLVIYNGTTRRLESFRQFSMSGGNDRMTKEQLRQWVISTQRHNNRAVSPEDVKNICSELSFVSKVEAEAVLRFVYVYVLTTDGSTLSASQQSRIHELLAPKLIMGYTPSISSVSKVKIFITLQVYILGSASRWGATNSAKGIVLNLLDPQKSAEIGDGVKMSTISKEILQNIPGCSNVTYSRLHRESVSSDYVRDIEFSSNEVVDIDNSVIDIEIIGGV